MKDYFSWKFGPKTRLCIIYGSTLYPAKYGNSLLTCWFQFRVAGGQWLEHSPAVRSQDRRTHPGQDPLPSQGALSHPHTQSDWDNIDTTIHLKRTSLRCGRTQSPQRKPTQAVAPDRNQFFFSLFKDLVYWVHSVPLMPWRRWLTNWFTSALKECNCITWVNDLVLGTSLSFLFHRKVSRSLTSVLFVNSRCI